MVVERDTPLGLEQTSVQVNGGRLTYVTNSNFLQSEKASHHILGIFEASAPGLAKKIADLAKKTIPKPNRRVHVSPHNLRVRMNGKPVPLGTRLYEEIVSLVSGASDGAALISKDGVIVTRGAGAGPQRLSPGSPVSEAKTSGFLECSPLESSLPVCSVKGFGYVHR
ncbi:MAG: hypothetical protein HUU37_01445 [Bdellovibrionales bacterium]|nr:hypothetical protein [Bdellovibrionales bacterium]